MNDAANKSTLSNPAHTALSFTTFTATDAAGRVWSTGRSAQNARVAARTRMRVEGVTGATLKALALTITSSDLASLANDALIRLRAARAALHVIRLGDGTAEHPFCPAGGVERLLSEDCVTVTEFTVNHRPFDAVSVGSAEEVAEYTAAESALQEALAALLAGAAAA